MKAIFTFKPDPKPHGLVRKLINLFNKPGFQEYIETFIDHEIIVEMKPKVQAGEKLQMYAFYRGPLMDVAVECFTAAGYEGVDKVVAHYLLQAQCAKDFVIDANGNEKPYTISMSDMITKRLHKYIQDCIFFLESELGAQNIPDAEIYKNKERTGHSFKSVKHLPRDGKE